MSARELLHAYRDTIALETWAEIDSHSFKKTASGWVRTQAPEYAYHVLLTEYEMKAVNDVLDSMSDMKKDAYVLIIINEFAKRMKLKDKLKASMLAGKNKYFVKRKAAIEQFEIVARNNTFLKAWVS